jgi:methylthioribulose-1-phosphate dehydratase
MTTTLDALRLATATDPIDALRQTGAMFHQRGWSLGTSSNYSVVLNRHPFELLLTASGKDKGHLCRTDFVLADEKGQAVGPAGERPSAEMWLHLAVANHLPHVGSVLHTHSVWGTLLSDRFAAEGGFWIEGYEMLKGLAGVNTHEHREWVPIFENTQDIPKLAAEVGPRLLDANNPIRHGFLIRRHGLYTWGKDLAEARRHIEIYEFLFEVVGRQLAAGG